MLLRYPNNSDLKHTQILKNCDCVRYIDFRALCLLKLINKLFSLTRSIADLLILSINRFYLLFHFSQTRQMLMEFVKQTIILDFV